MAFREDVVTQAAGVLMVREQNRLGSGVPRMNYMKLLKLLYLAERSSLLEATKSMSGDRLIGMSKGPLLSETYDLIKASSTGNRTGYWCQHIKTEGYDVVMIDHSAMEYDDLSDADESRLHRIYDQFGHMNEEELVEWTHENLAEWTDPKGSSRSIPTRDIFFAAELSDEVALKKERDLYQLEQFERALNC
jgi:uncharacterized phage-associated protein